MWLMVAVGIIRIYGSMTGGLFSLCQSIGATASVAPPLAIGLGIGALAIGAGVAFSPRNEERSGDDDEPPSAGSPMTETRN
ncbi:hypothetical protein MPER_10493 [Moniliophthora perniciosa FA553]|nr:hypothetical protein MPER_10493 [Moniliophthora perniciosa FA553]